VLAVLGAFAPWGCVLCEWLLSLGCSLLGQLGCPYCSLFRSVSGVGISLVSVVLVLLVALGTGFVPGFSILFLLYCMCSLFFLMNDRAPTVFLKKNKRHLRCITYLHYIQALRKKGTGKIIQVIEFPLSGLKRYLVFSITF
jgi:hypothetical protein